MENMNNTTENINKEVNKNTNKNVKKTNGKNNKKTILIIVAIVIIAIIVALIIKIATRDVRVIKTAKNEIDMSNLENVEIVDGKKVNNSEEMKMMQPLDELTCEIKELTANEKEAKVVMEVRNNGQEEFAGRKINIVFTEKEGKKFGELGSYIGKIPAGETIQLELTTTLDVTNAYSYYIELLEE